MAATEPILNVPRGVILAAALMAAIQLVRGLLPDDVDLTLLLTLAFIPARYSGAALQLPGGYLTCITSFVTYVVVHAGWVHLLVNVLWMLAFGSAVARRVGNGKFVVFNAVRRGRRVHPSRLPFRRHGASCRRLGGDLRADGRSTQIYLQG